MPPLSTSRCVNLDVLLKNVIRSTMEKAFPNVETPEPLVVVGKFSEYQCNNAMGLAKLLQKQKPPIKLSPKAVGEELQKNLCENDFIEAFEPTDAGFINVTIKSSWAADKVKQLLSTGVLPPEVEPLRVLVDYSSPNIAKELHVGHLRSTIIGEALCRVLEFCGHSVDRINHVGDWGTAFGMLILYIKRNYPNYMDNPPDISDLDGFYKAAKACFDESEEFKEQSRREVVKLQALEPESIETWKFICDVSRKEFQIIYDMLGVTIEERGESFYNPIIPKVLQLLDEAGQLEDSDGAKLIVSKEPKDINSLGAKEMTKLASQHLAKLNRSGPWFHPNLIAAMKKAGIMTGAEGEEVVVLSKKETKPWSKFDVRKDLDKLMAQLAPLYTKTLDPLFREAFEADGIVDGDTIKVPRFSYPLMVLKSDGGYNYDTTDIACMYHRFVMEKINRVIYCTDLGQFDHFNMCAQVAKDMHWMDNATWDHVGFGLVSGADGKKFKARAGDTTKLKDLLIEAVDRERAVLEAREAGDRAQGHTPEEIERLARIIGIGAVKYFDLKQSRTNDYTFDYDKMLDLSGNTAVFLLYQYARMRSIKAKAGVTEAELQSVESVSLETPQEKKLALCLFRFEAVILKTVEDLFPHHLTDYAYELVSCFSDFFEHCKVVGDPLQNSRLCLIEVSMLTLGKTLNLLNLELADRI